MSASLALSQILQLHELKWCFAGVDGTFSPCQSTDPGVVCLNFSDVPRTQVRSCHAHCPAPFQATPTMLLPGEVTATAWLLAAYTCDVVYARQCSYPVSALSGVHLPGKSTVGRR